MAFNYVRLSAKKEGLDKTPRKRSCVEPYILWQEGEENASYLGIPLAVQNDSPSSRNLRLRPRRCGPEKWGAPGWRVYSGSSRGGPLTPRGPAVSRGKLVRPRGWPQPCDPTACFAACQPVRPPPGPVARAVPPALAALMGARRACLPDCAAVSCRAMGMRRLLRRWPGCTGSGRRIKASLRLARPCGLRSR